MADDHKHGDMDTDVQEKTFDGFIKATTYSVLAIFVVLVLLALFAS
ncbi:MAG: aa3-type cytochrome c oxidase subunit IV [Pseudomonadota bacterium]